LEFAAFLGVVFVYVSSDGGGDEREDMIFGMFILERRK
jgi:hypothetical protein